MIKQFCSNHPPLACVRERENIYKLLSGTTNDSLQKNHKLFTIDPKTRYTAFDSKKVSNMTSLHSLYDTDDKENADFSVLSPQQKEKDIATVKRRRKSSSGGMIDSKFIRIPLFFVTITEYYYATYLLFFINLKQKYLLTF